MAAVCLVGHYTVLPDIPHHPPYDWPPNSTCRASAGLCYTSATVVMGSTTVQVGCWPPAAPGELSYSGSQARSFSDNRCSQRLNYGCIHLGVMSPTATSKNMASIIIFPDFLNMDLQYLCFIKRPAA